MRHVFCVPLSHIHIVRKLVPSFQLKTAPEPKKRFFLEWLCLLAVRQWHAILSKPLNLSRQNARHGREDPVTHLETQPLF